MLKPLKPLPLSLYIHYPWCVKKCPYCDFNSHEKSDETGYISALLTDLQADLKYVQGRKISSIFIGGGTPSLLSSAELNELFSGLQKRLDFAANIEITLETNPGSFEAEKFKAFKNIGINRLSIGVQTFNDKNLQFLGRIHNAAEAEKACSQAAQIFDNFNIDLMYGLAGQGIEACLNDINQALDFAPSHISFYQLTIEPNTYFAKFPPILPKSDDIWKMGNAGVKLLEVSGFKRYEVSAFGKIASKHNLNYWQFGDYLGIGAGAHGKISQANGEIIRTVKAKSPKQYLQNPQRKITKIDNLAFEFMLNALRLKSGFAPELFALTTNLPLASINEKLQFAKKLGLLNISDKLIQPTEKGYNFLNDLTEEFL
ncbi:MAG: radical SAM family heme chaperone HemW [Candidatus Thioglobus sp.]|nr:radical SAM family heme chaperone HemW [Candidatus Thioglobus sp.]